MQQPDALSWKLSRWLNQSALRGAELEIVVAGCCELLSTAGIPIKRLHLSFSMLHPLYGALNLTWQRGEKLETMRMGPEARKSERFLRSPYFHMLERGLQHLRLRPSENDSPQFPVIADLQEQRITDYMAFVQSLGEHKGRAMLGSWATDAETGFSDEAIEVLKNVQTDLAAAAKMAIASRLTENMLTTYLGNDAGRRVLSGQVRRGDGDTVRAMLVMVDMRRSTQLAEREGRQNYINALNSFFDAIAAPFNRNGGAILNFMGDGFLAVYPCKRHRAQSQEAARAALDAACQAVSRMSALNADRRHAGEEEIGYGIGLHVGNVMYGNVGLKDRLTFSVFGASVNESERLQALTKKYHMPLLASQAFSEYCDGKWTTLGEETLRGLTRPTRVMAPMRTHVAVDDYANPLELEVHDGASEAEHILMLHDNLGFGGTSAR